MGFLGFETAQNGGFRVRIGQAGRGGCCHECCHGFCSERRRRVRLGRLGSRVGSSGNAPSLVFCGTHLRGGAYGTVFGAPLGYMRRRARRFARATASASALAAATIHWAAEPETAAPTIHNTVTTAQMITATVHPRSSRACSLDDRRDADVGRLLARFCGRTIVTLGVPRIRRVQPMPRRRPLAVIASGRAVERAVA